MTPFIKVAGQASAAYREEPARDAIIIALVALVLAGVAMGLYFRKLANQNHEQKAMTTSLVEKTEGVDKTAEDIHEALAADQIIAQPNPDPTPDPTPIGQSGLWISAELNRLPGTIEGIIWNASNPLVMIDGDLHSVGDKVVYTMDGEAIAFAIVKISEEAVVFRNPFGEEFEESLYRESDKLNK